MCSHLARHHVTRHHTRLAHRSLAHSLCLWLTCLAQVTRIHLSHHQSLTGWKTACQLVMPVSSHYICIQIAILFYIMVYSTDLENQNFKNHSCYCFQLDVQIVVFRQAEDCFVNAVSDGALDVWEMWTSSLWRVVRRRCIGLQDMSSEASKTCQPDCIRCFESRIAPSDDNLWCMLTSSRLFNRTRQRFDDTVKMESMNTSKFNLILFILFIQYE